MLAAGRCHRLAYYKRFRPKGIRRKMEGSNPGKLRTEERIMDKMEAQNGNV